MINKKRLIFVFISLFYYSTSLLAESQNSSDASLYSTALQFVDDSDKPAYLATLAGTPTIVSMVYTRCNGSCPLTIRRLKLIDQKLKEQGRYLNFLLVSFDSENDVPAKLRSFRESNSWDARWHLWRGSDAATRAFSVLTNISYQRDPDSGHYAHSNKIILLDDGGKIVHSVEGLTAPIDGIVEQVSKLLTK